MSLFLPIGSQRVKKYQGFTIVELLVVMAIISLLIAMLVPTLHKARETARDAQCKVNMRQVFQAIFTYASDNKGYHPTRINVTGTSIMDILMAATGMAPYSKTLQVSYTNFSYTGLAPEVWFSSPGGGADTRYMSGFAALHPEIIKKTIFYCPGELMPSQNGTTDVTYGSYASCDRLYPNIANGTKDVPYYGINMFSAQGVLKPSQSMAMCCSGGTVRNGTRETYYQGTYAYASGNETGWVGNRRWDGAYMKHNRNTNGVFFDGHVGLVKPNDVQPNAALLTTAKGASPQFMWNGADLTDFMLIDLSIILDPSNPNATRLTAGDIVAP